MFKVLVTGGSGFVGKNLLETLLLKKYSVYQAFYDKEKRLIDRVRKFNHKETEPLIDYENIEKIDCIIHCAAMLPDSKKKNFDEYQKFNVELTLLTAKQALNKGIKRFVYLSTVLADTTEKNYKNPNKKFYSISKRESEIALMKFSKQTGLDVIILRPTIVYGKYIKQNFKYLLDLVYRDIPLPFKNIKALKSYVGVDNLIDLIIVCMSHPKAVGKIFLVSDGDDISINNLIIKISKYMNKSPKLFALPLWLIKLIGYFFFRSGEINSAIEPFQVTNADVNKILGWRPVHSLDYGLEKMVYWYLKNR